MLLKYCFHIKSLRIYIDVSLIIAFFIQKKDPNNFNIEWTGIREVQKGGRSLEADE